MLVGTVGPQGDNYQSINQITSADARSIFISNVDFAQLQYCGGLKMYTHALALLGLTIRLLSNRA